MNEHTYRDRQALRLAVVASVVRRGRSIKEGELLKEVRAEILHRAGRRGRHREMVTADPAVGVRFDG